VIATHDDRRLLDQRQALLDPVGERRAGGCEERADADGDVVASSAGQHRPRFSRCRSKT
jgi:hypothetical protein